MKCPYSAIFLLYLPKDEAEIISKSLNVETKRGLRTKISIEINEKNKISELIVRVKAKDIVSLRAGINSNLRWLDCLQKILQVIDDGTFPPDTESDYTT